MFQKDLIVWKPAQMKRVIQEIAVVSEGLNSVETGSGIFIKGGDVKCFRRT